ncbi:MAG: class I tRNA ligase family protein, partial [Acidimicrobiia bacterium]
MAKQSDFTRVQPRADLPAMEREILDLWDRIDAFKTQVEMRPVESDYVFYDGPPFANGSPHYGHILAGVIKDVVPRFWAMKGRRVERRFGWDTHGLPVEMEVEKQLGISGPKQIAEYGI